MQLTIMNKDLLELDGFCEWLVEFLKDVFRQSLDPLKLKARDEKVNLAINKILPQTLTAEVAIKLAINNIEWKKQSKGKYQIFINQKAMIYGTSNTIYEVAKYIEFGGKGLMPLNFFRPLFSAVGKDINDYYSTYLDITGG